ECASSAAAREAEALLPTLDEAAARRSLDETDEARRLLAEGGVPVTGVRDISRAVDLASRGGVLEPSDLADVARTLESLARLKDALATVQDEAPLLWQRGSEI